MNKKLLVGMFSAFMAMVPLTGYADQTIDSPHVNVDSNGGTEDCTYCHFANYQPSDCVRCHSNNNAPYGDGTAPLVSTHKNLDCQACHNPHVSLQAAGIAGAYTGITANTPSTGMTTLTGVTPTPDVSWAEKTGPERGMILWIANGTDAQGNPQSASFEIKGIDATAGTVVVKGDVPVASGNFDLRRGQLIAKKVTKTAASSYRQGDLPVEFPSQGSTSIFIDTVNATPTGVCQVCHTQTAYWKNDGSAVTHNADKACTQCHKHSSGFLVTGCTACHPGAEPDGAPTVYPDQMALPSTGSETAGQHLIHATDQGYNFPCATCHYGTGMDRINAPTNPVKGDGIQIGFNWGTFKGYLTSYNGQSTVDGVAPHASYVGTNYTTVTNTGAVGDGSLTCSNVYCHSDGTALRRGCATAMPNTSPAWDGSSVDPQGDTVKCNNCHGYTTGLTNIISTGKHTTHVQSLNIPCYACHGDTVSAGGNGEVSTDKVSVLTNKTNHANAVYNIKGSGTYYGTPLLLDSAIISGTGNWNPTTKNCTVTCHNYQRNWTANDTGSCPDPCVGLINDNPTVNAQCSNVDNNTIILDITMDDPDRNDPVKKQCAAAQGKTGYNNAAGGVNVVYGGGAAWTGLAEKNQEWLGVTGDGVTVTRVAQVYPLAAVKAPNPAITGHNNPFVYLSIKAWDNGPGAQANALADNVLNPGEGWGWPIQTDPATAFMTCELNPNFDTMLNQPAHIDFTVGQVNNNTITITDKSTDPDYNNVAKADYYDALKAGGNAGHRGQPGYVHIYYNMGEGEKWHAMTFTDVPNPQVIPHTYWNATNRTNVLDGGAGTHTWSAATPGSVWFFYEVLDNHYLYQNPGGYNSTSGWINYTFQ